MSKPITRHVIERARMLIADESQWCRGALARDERGRQVDPTDTTARRRCAFGGLVAAAFEFVGIRGKPMIWQMSPHARSGALLP